MKRIQTFYIFDPVLNAGKMIFLFGPRQIGKTTFVQNILRSKGIPDLYFNWDDPMVPREYFKNPHFLKAKIAGKKQAPLISFDEIHKHKNWKNILKGLYDIHRDHAQFIITGSARLDYFRKSGDSLVGRYFSYSMLPLGVPEAMQSFQGLLKEDTFLRGDHETELLAVLNGIHREAKDAFDQLFHFSGFPEPFLKGNNRFSIKWRRDYKSLLLHEDLRELSRIQDIKGLEHLLLLLPERIGSPLSINSLREDLQINHRTAANWLEALKKIYLIFSIHPWSKKIAKAIKKEPKIYFHDWTMVPDEGARFENMLAVTLLKFVFRLNEVGAGNYDLRYIRTQQGKEIDFVLIKDNRPLALFEAKLSAQKPAPAGRYFGGRMNIPFYQIVANSNETSAWPDRCYQIPAWQIMALLG